MPIPNWWDNAPIAFHWGFLKTELIHHRRFVTREQAERGITEYIEPRLSISQFSAHE